MDSKKNRLFVFLMGIFLCNALLAEIVGVKIFSLETLLGLPPAEIPLLGDWVLSFDLTAGVLIWPTVFITTDVINEYFGKKGVQLISFLTIGLIFYAFLIIWAVTGLPPAQWWIAVNSGGELGDAFNIDQAFSKIFLQSIGIIIGSMVAFLIGQFLDVFVFHKLRRLTGSGKIWLRATGSTLVSQLVDSFVVLFIAFYAFGPWSLEQFVSVAIINYLFKFVVAIILTPLLYVAHGLIDRYLGKELSEQLTEEASEKSQGFF